MARKYVRRLFWTLLMVYWPRMVGSLVVGSGRRTYLRLRNYNQRKQDDLGSDWKDQDDSLTRKKALAYQVYRKKTQPAQLFVP